MTFDNQHQGAGSAASGFRPLAGLKVVDFSTLLPGPLAALILGDAGAEVVKIERPGTGEDMRGYAPRLGGESGNFVLLNRGKQSRSLDLKNPADNATAKKLVEEADILIEQFRPGVMDRLGLGYEAMHAINPRLIYCSITGYGQTGPKAHVPAHDLNYIADAGLLSLTADSDGTPVIPAMPLADIAGGSYPAVINVLLALLERAQTGRGRHLDISMSDNVFPFTYWAMAKTLAGEPVKPSGELVTGGSPRYSVYRARDGRHIAAGPLEDKFWFNFCKIIGVGTDADKQTVAAAIAARDAADWLDRLNGQEVCCALVNTMEEAMADPHFAARNCFANQVTAGDVTVPALPLPLVEAYRDPVKTRPAPVLEPR